MWKNSLLHVVDIETYVGIIELIIICIHIELFTHSTVSIV